MNGGIDPETYLRERAQLLGEEVLQRRRIYLDTNFWIRLRQQATGHRTDPATARLLHQLRDGVRNKNWVCVFSGYALQELLKHDNPSLHHTTALIVDELGKGFCLAPPDRLLREEIDSWLLSWMRPQQPFMLERATRVWARPAFLWLDYVPPPVAGLSPEEQGQLQRGFLDHMWSYTLGEVIAQLAAYAEPMPSPEWTALAAASVNEDLKRVAGESRTKLQLYLDEVAGIVETLLDRFVERFMVLGREHGLRLPTPDEGQACRYALHHAVVAGARAQSIALTLPSIHICATLHAQVRRDRGRKYKANDFLDIEHAQSALPYCDAFLTDKAHAQLITASRLQTSYGCQVFASAEQAGAWLDSFSR